VHDILVTELARELRFLDEPGHGSCVDRDCFGHYLECHPAVHGVLPRLIDDAHSPTAYLPAGRVVAERAEGRLLSYTDFLEDFEVGPDLLGKNGVFLTDLTLVEHLARIQAVDVPGDDLVEPGFRLHHFLSCGCPDREAGSNSPCPQRRP
jgi:hypothetical protein